MPQELILSKDSISAIINSLKKEGLYVVSETVAKFGVDISKKRQKLMKKVSVSAYECAKYELIDNVKSADTIKNMIKDHRLGKNEFFKNENDVLHITTMAIKRLNNQ